MTNKPSKLLKTNDGEKLDTNKPSKLLKMA